MNKIHKNEKGFSAVEVVMVIVIIALIGVVGWMVYKNQHKTPVKVSIAKTTSSPSTSKTSPANNSSTAPQASYLVIKEWGVKLLLTTPINDATYQIVTNNQYIKPAAFLSTATLDASADCKAYYLPGAPNDPTPTFQDIERYSLTDTTSLYEGGPTITASQAAQQSPSTYKLVGNYVYYFRHGNGSPCKEQTTAQTDAFETAFSTIQLN